MALMTPYSRRRSTTPEYTVSAMTSVAAAKAIPIISRIGPSMIPARTSRSLAARTEGERASRPVASVIAVAIGSGSGVVTSR